MAKAIDGSGSFDRRVDDVEAFVGQRVAGKRVLQFRHRADIAGVQLGHRLQRLAVRNREMRQALGGVAPFVRQRRIVLDDAGDDLEISDAAGEGIGGSLEHVGRAPCPYPRSSASSRRR